jgi:hypothetical protein
MARERPLPRILMIEVVRFTPRRGAVGHHPVERLAGRILTYEDRSPAITRERR